jgi:bacterioferritin-associated ferredoxin
MRDEEVLCRCVEVTYGEVRAAIRMGLRTVRELRRFTRAGTGTCQGRTCEKLLAQLISAETRVPLRDLGPPSYRVPVSPVAMDVLAGETPSAAGEEGSS